MRSKKTELDLKRADETLGEVYKVAGIGSADAFDQALENYHRSQERLQSRLELLKDKNKNTEELVQKILNRMLGHGAAFSAMQDDLGASREGKMRMTAAKTLKSAHRLNESAFKKMLPEIVQNPARYNSYMIFGETETSLAEMGEKAFAEHGKNSTPSIPPLPSNPPRPNPSSEGSEIFCTQEYNPICGLDGKTYGNSCMAETAGIGIQYEGECKKANSK